MDDLCGPLCGPVISKTKKWDTRKLKRNIGSENNKVILYMHAFLGCGSLALSVSQIYVAKNKILKAQIAQKRKEDCQIF